MSSYSRSMMKRVDPLSKKIPTNPKYKHVKSTIDTGASLTKYMQKIEDIRQNYKFRKDEIFKRMKLTTFAQLVIQIYRVTAQNGDTANEEAPYEDGTVPPLDQADQEVKQITDGRTSPVPSIALTDGDFGFNSELATDRSTLQSVIRGVGQYDLNFPAPLAPSVVSNECPYLVLDVRDREDYDTCHILSALSYSKAILSRATNYESKEMLAYKNKPGKIIIVYDEDERIAPGAATTLVQRGYDNLFLLSGGLKVAGRLFPDGLLTGQLSSQSGGGGGERVNPPAEMRDFTDEDINQLEIYLDNALQDKSIGSRLSHASTTSSRRSTSVWSGAMSTSSMSSRPAFRPP